MSNTIGNLNCYFLNKIHSVSLSWSEIINDTLSPISVSCIMKLFISLSSHILFHSINLNYSLSLSHSLLSSCIQWFYFTLSHPLERDSLYLHCHSFTCTCLLCQSIFIWFHPLLHLFKYSCHLFFSLFNKPHLTWQPEGMKSSLKKTSSVECCSHENDMSGRTKFLNSKVNCPVDVTRSLDQLHSWTWSCFLPLSFSLSFSVNVTHYFTSALFLRHTQKQMTWCGWKLLNLVSSCPHRHVDRSSSLSH